MARSADRRPQGTDRLRHQVLEGPAGLRGDGTFRRAGGGRDGDVSDDETGDGADAEGSTKAPGDASCLDNDGRGSEIEGSRCAAELLGSPEVDRWAGRHTRAQDGKE